VIVVLDSLDAMFVKVKMSPPGSPLNGTEISVDTVIRTMVTRDSTVALSGASAIAGVTHWKSQA
jgi:hypothetical protein